MNSIGFAKLIPSCATERFELVLWQAFRPKYFLVEYPGPFSILEFSLGRHGVINTEQGPVFAGAYADVPKSPDLYFDADNQTTLDPGTKIVLVVVNNSPGAMFFRSSLIGRFAP